MAEREPCLVFRGGKTMLFRVHRQVRLVLFLAGDGASEAL